MPPFLTFFRTFAIMKKRKNGRIFSWHMTETYCSSMRNCFLLPEKIFYYGCYSAKDFERIDGIKPNVFSRYKNFLLQTLGNHIEEFTLSDGKTGVLRFRTNEFETPFNILLSLYTLKKISEQDFLFFIETMLFFTGTNEENYVPLAKLTGIAQNSE